MPRYKGRKRRKVPCIVGIDPGKSGAVAVLNGESVSLLKLKEEDSVIAEFLLENTDHRTAIYLEAVHSGPLDGKASAFKFGMNFGFLTGILSVIEVILGPTYVPVSPQKWQRAMGVIVKGRSHIRDNVSSKKRIHKEKAQTLFPNINVYNWNCDALLIAEYGRRQYV